MDPSDCLGPLPAAAAASPHSHHGGAGEAAAAGGPVASARDPVEVEIARLCDVAGRNGSALAELAGLLESVLAASRGREAALGDQNASLEAEVAAARSREMDLQARLEAATEAAHGREAALRDSNSALESALHASRGREELLQQQIAHLERVRDVWRSEARTGDMVREIWAAQAETEDLRQQVADLTSPGCDLFPGVPCAQGFEVYLHKITLLLLGRPVERVLDYQELVQLTQDFASAHAPAPSSPQGLGNLPAEIVVSDDRPSVTVVGDLHGQIQDLLDGCLGPVLRGDKQTTRWVFLGDYVDRGPCGLDVFCLLAMMRVCFPDYVVMLRGNHEDMRTCEVFGFWDECQSKYPHPAPPQSMGHVWQDAADTGGSPCVWEAVSKAFGSMPIAAVIRHSTSGRAAFCCHGGLSPPLVPQDGRCPGAIQLVCSCKRGQYTDHRDRDCLLLSPTEEPSPRTTDCITGLLWADPCDKLGPQPLFQESARGCGALEWSEEASQRFCEDNCFDLIIRAHQLQTTGVQMDHGKKVITVFSASDYCQSRNYGAVLIVDHEWWPIGGSPRSMHHYCSSTEPAVQLGPQAHAAAQPAHQRFVAGFFSDAMLGDAGGSPGSPAGGTEAAAGGTAAAAGGTAAAAGGTAAAAGGTAAAAGDIVTPSQGGGRMLDARQALKD